MDIEPSTATQCLSLPISIHIFFLKKMEYPDFLISVIYIFKKTNTLQQSNRTFSGKPMPTVCFSVDLISILSCEDSYCCQSVCTSAFVSVLFGAFFPQTLGCFQVLVIFQVSDQIIPFQGHNHNFPINYFSFCSDLDS